MLTFYRNLANYFSATHTAYYFSATHTASYTDDTTDIKVSYKENNSFAKQKSFTVTCFPKGGGINISETVTASYKQATTYKEFTLDSLYFSNRQCSVATKQTLTKKLTLNDYIT